MKIEIVKNFYPMLSDEKKRSCSSIIDMRKEDDFEFSPCIVIYRDEIFLKLHIDDACKFLIKADFEAVKNKAAEVKMPLILDKSNSLGKLFNFDFNQNEWMPLGYYSF